MYFVPCRYDTISFIGDLSYFTDPMIEVPDNGSG